MLTKVSKDGGMIYKMANNMTDAEYEKKLSSLNEKQKNTYESLVRLGDSPKLALATTLLSNEVKWSDETIKAYTMSDGGEIGKEGFTIGSMREHLKNKFPDSFGFELNALKKGSSSEPDYDKAGYGGYKDSDIKSKLYFPQYKRDHSINFSLRQGGENTYFDFLLEDKNGNGYVGGFGFKDQGDVPSDYVTSFLAFLMEEYGLPFEIKHEVMAKGGYTGEPHRLEK